MPKYIYNVMTTVVVTAPDEQAAQDANGQRPGNYAVSPGGNVIPVDLLSYVPEDWRGVTVEYVDQDVMLVMVEE